MVEKQIMEEKQFIERKIIIGCVIDTPVLGFVAKHNKPGIFESKTAKVILSWLLDYFARYAKAPKQDLESLYFEQVKRQSIDVQTAADVEGILTDLSEEWDYNFNSEYCLDITKKYFKEQVLRRTADNIIGSLSRGDVLEAEKSATEYSAEMIPETDNVVDPFSDKDAVEQAFTSQAEPLMKYPKALGQFLNEQLTRGSFVFFMGPEKRGKTFWLLELAMKAHRDGNRVVFFQAGDMTEPQFIRRMGIYLCKCSDLEQYCQGTWVPVLDCVLNQKDMCKKKARESYEGLEIPPKCFDDYITCAENQPDYKPCRNCKNMIPTVFFEYSPKSNPITASVVWKKFTEYINKPGRKKNTFKLATYPSDCLSVFEIESVLKIWERTEGFVPDVIVIDYADILAPNPNWGRMEYRQQTNKIWQALRTLSQKQHCCLITATQAAASSYGKKTIQLGDFSEDKRKYAHPTAGYALNQWKDEKEKGILRLSELLKREGRSFGNIECAVLQRLEIGRPFLGSYLIKKEFEETEEEE